MRSNSPEFPLKSELVRTSLDGLYLLWKVRVAEAEQVFDTLVSLQNKLSYVGVGTSLKLSQELLDFLEVFAQKHGMQGSINETAPSQTGTVLTATASTTETHPRIDYKRTKSHFLIKSERMAQALQALHSFTAGWLQERQPQSVRQVENEAILTELELPMEGVVTTSQAHAAVLTGQPEVAVQAPAARLVFTTEQIAALHTDWQGQQNLLAKGITVQVSESSFVVRWLRDALHDESVTGLLAISSPDRQGYVTVALAVPKAQRVFALATISKLLPAICEEVLEEDDVEMPVRRTWNATAVNQYPHYWSRPEETEVALDFCNLAVQKAVQAVMQSPEHSYYVPEASELEEAIRLFMREHQGAHYYAEGDWLLLKPTTSEPRYIIIHRQTQRRLDANDYSYLAVFLDYLMEDAVLDEEIGYGNPW